jgi:pyrroloquinoline quinone biosynthesis protein D
VSRLSPASVPALPRGVRLRFDKVRNVWTLLAPERVLMPDEIAVEILRRCDGKATVAAIVDDLARTFAAPREEIAADVEELLQDLADKGLVTDRPAP